MSASLKDLRHKMELGDYEDPTVTTTSTGELLDRSASPPVDTAVPAEKLSELNEALLEVPDELQRSTASCASRSPSGSTRWPTAASTSATPRRWPSPRC